MGNSQPNIDPKEQLRQSKHQINRSIRSIDSERGKLDKRK